MAQTRELFFDAETVEGLPDRVYQAADWPAIFGRSFTDGYLDLDEWADPLLVEASDPAAMTVEVNDGAAWLQGRFFELYDGPQTLVVPDADPANPRIDRVVVRLDLAERVISLALLQGTAAGVPTAPALTRTSSIWELSLAQLAIAAGATSVVGGNITDERDDDAVCGVAASALESGSYHIVTGAAGDGVTDDRAAIQAVIDAAEAAGGGTVFLPAGTYLLGSVTTGAVCLRVDSDNVRIVGASRGATTLLLDAAMDAHVINFDGVANCSIQHLTINGNRAGNGAGHGLRMAGTTDFLVHDATITECAGYGIGMQAGTFAHNHIVDVLISRTGSDGLDCKNSNSDNGRNFVRGLTVREHGLSAATDQAGVDVRGPWVISDVVIDTFGSGSDITGLRLRSGESGEANGAGAHYSTVTNVQVTAATSTATTGVKVEARNCSVVQAQLVGCGVGILIGATETRLTDVLAASFGAAGFRFAATGSRTLGTNLWGRSGATSSVAFDIQTNENQLANILGRVVHDMFAISGDWNRILMAHASNVTGTFMTNTGANNYQDLAAL